MKKILFTSIFHNNIEVFEAEHGEEWGGDVAGYLDNTDTPYDEISALPEGMTIPFTNNPENICIAYNNGLAVEVYWSQEY